MTEQQIGHQKSCLVWFSPFQALSHCQLTFPFCDALPGQIPTSNMAQKVATARKMKSQQENLPRPNCDSDGKANTKRQAFISTDTRSFKIQTGDMGPPPGRASSVAKTAYFGGRVSCNPSTLYIVAAPSSLPFVFSHYNWHSLSLKVNAMDSEHNNRAFITTIR